MRFITKIWLVLLTVALLSGAAWAASFSVSLDRDTMTLGEQATLSLKFDGVQPQDAPAIPQVEGLDFQYAGRSSSIVIDNGQTSSGITFSYIVTARHDGEFNIPAMQTTVGGQRLTSGALRLAVNKADAPSAAAVQSGNEVAFVKLVFPKQKVYVGECAVARLDLYLRDDVARLGNFQMDSAPTDGFNAGQVTELRGPRGQVRIGNHLYSIVHLGIPLRTLRTGRLVLGPFAGSLVVVLPSNDEGSDPFANLGIRSPFFHGEQKQITFATESVDLDSQPLPEQNKPANFNGAVGNFTMSATAGPTTVTVGDPITVRVQISGHGALDAVTLPVQSAWHDFKTFPPTTKLETTDQFGFQGTKSFEQIVSPENADVHDLPALTLSFFNPDDGCYHTLTQAAVPLVVKTAGATPVPALATAKNTPPETQTPLDIGPIKDNLGTLAVMQAPLVARPAFLAAQTLPVLAFLAAFIWRRQTDNLAHNPRLRRHRAVAQLVAGGLEDLKQCAAANQPDEFFATLFRLLQEQLGERLDCPASAITENVMEEHALLRDAPADLRDALREQFQLCNQARYAPVRGASELHSVAAQFEKLIHELQKLQ